MIAVDLNTLVRVRWSPGETAEILGPYRGDMPPGKKLWACLNRYREGNRLICERLDTNDFLVVRVPMAIVGAETEMVYDWTVFPDYDSAYVAMCIGHYNEGTTECWLYD